MSYTLSPVAIDNSSLKTFDKVLVRDDDYDTWIPSIFACEDANEGDNVYITVDGRPHPQCLPYEKYKHLMFTEDAPQLDNQNSEDEE